MAIWLRQSTSVDIAVGPFLDSTDGNTQETALTITQPDVRLKKNGAAWAQKNAAQTLSHEEAGWYEVTLDATDTDTLGLLTVAIHESGALAAWERFMIVTPQVYDSFFSTDLLQVDATQLLGSAFATPTVAGVPEVDVTHWIGTAAATPTVAGVPEVDVTHFGGSAGTFTSGKPDVQTVNALAANTITATSIATAAITAAKLAAGAIDANALAADAITEIRSIVSGTADSGTTSTMVDAARTEADADYWKDAFILFTSGNIAGQLRMITAFNATSDTITFTPATTQAVGTNTYEILTNGGLSNLRQWNGDPPSNLDGGSVQAKVVSFQAGAIDATAIANGAIDAATFAAGAIDNAAFAVTETLTANPAPGGITAASFGAGAIDAAAIATGAIDADALAADAVTEIWSKAMTELSAVPGVTGTVLEALQWLFLLSRNKLTQTATTQLLRNDADSATVGTSTLSDDGTTFTRGEFA